MKSTEHKNSNTPNSRKPLAKSRLIKGTFEHKKALGGNNASADNNAAMQQILGAMSKNQEGIKQLMNAMGGKEFNQQMQQVFNAFKESLGKPL